MTTAHQQGRETQGGRAALALNELGAAVDAILSACELLGVTPAALGLARGAALTTIPTSDVATRAIRPQPRWRSTTRPTDEPAPLSPGGRQVGRPRSEQPSLFESAAGES